MAETDKSLFYGKLQIYPVGRAVYISQKTIMEGRRFISRYYRNRRLGKFLKELDLSEGHSTGIPTIQDELEKNGSPRAEFFTDDDRRATRIRIPIHPAFLFIK